MSGHLVKNILLVPLYICNTAEKNWYHVVQSSNFNQIYNSPMPIPIIVVSAASNNGDLVSWKTLLPPGPGPPPPPGGLKPGTLKFSERSWTWWRGVGRCEGSSLGFGGVWSLSLAAVWTKRAQRIKRWRGETTCPLWPIVERTSLCSEAILEGLSGGRKY